MALIPSSDIGEMAGGHMSNNIHDFTTIHKIGIKGLKEELFDGFKCIPLWSLDNGSVYMQQLGSSVSWFVDCGSTYEAQNHLVVLRIKILALMLSLLSRYTKRPRNRRLLELSRHFHRRPADPHRVRPVNLLTDAGKPIISPSPSLLSPLTIQSPPPDSSPSPSLLSLADSDLSQIPPALKCSRSSTHSNHFRLRTLRFSSKIEKLKKLLSSVELIFGLSGKDGELFDLSTSVPGNKLLMDKPHHNGDFLCFFP
ncbi:hypothetical protein LguiB_027353 [Lonicera macranthoides]